MKAVILAGGKGARLRPYTTILPKPLMPIGDIPILEVIIKQLKSHGLKEVTLAVGYLKGLLEAYFGNGEKWGVKINYSDEDKPLGTAAPLKLIKDLPDNFLVMNGDILTTLDFSDFYSNHIEKNALCTIAIYKKPIKIDLGVLELDENNIIRDYIEKPTLNYSVSMGIYAFHRSIINDIPENEYFDFPDLIKLLIKNNKQVNGYHFNGDWLDIGRKEDYEAALSYFEENKDLFFTE